MTRTQKAYGTWSSPISPKMLAGANRLVDVCYDSDGETLVWLERRGALGVLVAQRCGDAPCDLTDSSLSISGRVGYGGGEFTVAQGMVYASSGGRLYRLALDYGVPQPITPAFGAAAAPVVSNDGRWVAFVHHDEGVDGVAVVDAEGKLFPRKLAYGTDFVMQPAWNPRGTHLAYIAWNFPQMPWNGSELRLLTLAYDKSGMPYAAIEETLAGDAETAIFQPTFSPDGRYLAYISDASGFGHLYIHDLAEGTHTQLTSGECEYAEPGWVQGMRTFGWSADSRAVYLIRNEDSRNSLWIYDLETAELRAIPGLEDYGRLAQIALNPAADELALIASGDVIPSRVLSWSSVDGPRIVRRSSTERVAPAALARSQALRWPTQDGEHAYGLYYPPTSEAYEATGAPPIMVLVHGGPTSQRLQGYDAEAQFFATRGWAVLQVNHRGGTGYGKAYMNKHYLGWGIYDVLDSIDGVRWLAGQGMADASRAVIMGGSAGGYTVLQSLVDYPGFYKAAVCLYGVANQFSLVLDTHKFEARYSDWLLGPLPEAAERYRDRSPIFQADRIKDAIIVFQGAEDQVVPQNQSDQIVAALRRSGTPHEYIIYEGEGHGWRKPETIEDFYVKAERFLLQHVIYA